VIRATPKGGNKMNNDRYELIGDCEDEQGFRSYGITLETSNNWHELVDAIKYYRDHTLWFNLQILVRK
jgi:hypothetical protein